jgi:two-component system OmpR family response regulator
VRVLVVEDEPRLAAQMTAALEAATYAADWAPDGHHADVLVRTETYDAVVLDLGLPGADGLTLLRGWRDAGMSVPVLVLTARSGWSDKVRGIDGGADDYVAKPFRMEEVLARLRALVRRAAGHASNEIEVGAVRLDAKAGRVTVNGNPVKLTSHEFRLVQYLMMHTDKVVSRTELVEHLYDQDFDRDSNTIEVFVGRLRKKLGVDLIETIRGLGYRIASRGGP